VNGYDLVKASGCKFYKNHPLTGAGPLFSADTNANGTIGDKYGLPQQAKLRGEKMEDYIKLNPPVASYSRTLTAEWTKGNKTVFTVK
jgi:hypothetical protein